MANIKIGADLKKFIEKEISYLASNHLGAWKERYGKYRTIREVRFDLGVNHDDSLEIEFAEEQLKRKLTDDEQEYFCNHFHQAVCRQAKPFINQ